MYNSKEHVYEENSSTGQKPQDYSEEVLSGRNRPDSEKRSETDPETDEVTKENDNKLNKGIANECAKKMITVVKTCTHISTHN